MRRSWQTKGQATSPMPRREPTENSHGPTTTRRPTEGAPNLAALLQTPASGFSLAARASSASDKTSVVCNRHWRTPREGFRLLCASRWTRPVLSFKFFLGEKTLYSNHSLSGGRLSRSRLSAWVYKLWHQYHL